MWQEIHIPIINQKTFTIIATVPLTIELLSVQAVIQETFKNNLIVVEISGKEWRRILKRPMKSLYVKK